MKVFVLSDSPMPSGFGRISNEVCSRLVQRGHQVHVGSILWDGIALIDAGDWYAPPTHKYPFHISGLAGRDIWAYFNNLINLTQPDVVISCQDFPYAYTAYHNCRIDWSRRAFCIITPIDGEPIYEDWLRLVDDADGTMVISEFGVEAMRRAGKQVRLCPPGIDMHVFHPATSDERKALRAKANIPENAFVLGMMAMNQGRKDIPHTLDGFAKFSMDKPEALLYLDMDKVNPAGWNIPALAKTKGIPEGKILYKEDLLKRGLTELRDRYCILDAHSVLAHREGFGLPLVESQACKIPTIAAAWCSGIEVCGNGKGYLVDVLPQSRNSTWGGALDFDPDLDSFVKILEAVYNNPIGARAIAHEGYQWAIQRTWDKTADNVEKLLLEIEEKKNVSKRNSSGVLGTAASTKTGADVPSAPPESPKGSDSGGRLQPGLQSDGTPGAAVPSEEKRIEPGVCEDGERGSEDSQRGTPVLPEQ